ncbi:MAG: hypothetical protein AB1490_05330 [Pseudomonadota bacterium]
MSKGSTKNKMKPDHKAVVLFGLDTEETPRGARFTNEDEIALTRLAKGLGLRIGLANAPHQLAVVSKLPKGDMSATGLQAVPRIALDLHEKLNALVGGETGVISPQMPKTWDEIQPSSLVIAQDSLSAGWWPAVVTKRRGKQLVLKWRDYPTSEFIRDVNSVALLQAE